MPHTLPPLLLVSEGLDKQLEVHGSFRCGYGGDVCVCVCVCLCACVRVSE
jgi:hypothetical protein